MILIVFTVNQTSVAAFRVTRRVLRRISTLTRLEYSMNKLLAKTTLAIVGSLTMTAFLTAPLMAQDVDEERSARFEERRLEREEFLANNPDAAARMEERRQDREEFLANNPEAAERMEERQARIQERVESGEGRARPGRGFGGRGEGPPSGFRRDRGGDSEDI
jgi:hypothetical protein